MTGPTMLHLRAARDRVIDLLGLGKTAPLRDVDVLDDHLTVPHNTAALVVVEPGQPDVSYELHHLDGSGVPGASGSEGTGGRTELTTPPITADVTYQVLGTKRLTERSAVLRELARVRVGLDVTLPARIVAPPLVEVRAADGDPRIVEFGATVEVELDRTQEGVNYEVVAGSTDTSTVLSERPVRGDRGTITLRTVAMHEDVDLRVRATKRFEPSEDRPTQTELLAAVLPLRVRADPSLAVAVAAEVVDFGDDGAIAVATTQASARYQVWARRLEDDDFRYDGADGDMIPLPAAGIPVLGVRRAPRQDVPTSGFSAIGEAVPGSGGELRLPVPALDDDTVVLVTASKRHVASPAGSPLVESTVQLDAAAAVLVRPDPAPGLGLAVPVGAGRVAGDVLITGGEPGVFYTLSSTPGGAALTVPGYFHQVLDEAPKGVGRLRMGVDFVVPRDPESGERAYPATAPRVSLSEVLPLDATLHVTATKARTRVATALIGAAVIADPPAIRIEPAEIAAGQEATLVVEKSVVGDRYQPFLGGAPVAAGSDGNGEDLVFLTGALPVTTSFEMRITRPDERGVSVERRVTLPVEVAVP